MYNYYYGYSAYNVIRFWRCWGRELVGQWVKRPGIRSCDHRLKREGVSWHAISIISWIFSNFFVQAPYWLFSGYSVLTHKHPFTYILSILFYFSTAFLCLNVHLFPVMCSQAEWPVSSLSVPTALPGHVSRWALHREASEGRHGKVQEAAGRDNQRHQEEERGQKSALLQHVPRQNPQQCCCLKCGKYLWLRVWRDEGVMKW